MIKTFNSKVQWSVLIYNFFLCIIIVIFYFAIPILLNYPPNSINNDFERTIDMGMKYREQYIAISVLGMFFSNLLLLLQLHKIKDWSDFASGKNTDEKRLKKIKRNCFETPSKLYVIHVFIPTLTVYAGLIVTGAGNILALKITICMFAIFMVLGLLMYVLSKNIFNYVLSNLKNDEKFRTTFKISTYKERILLQILPLIILTGAFVYLSATSSFITEKSELIFDKYRARIVASDIETSSTLEELKDRLNKIEKIDSGDTLFIVLKDKVIYEDTKEELSDFFKKYIYGVENNGHTYGYYANEIQGAYAFVTIDGQKYAAGIMYNVNPLNSYVSVIVAFLSLFFFVGAFLLFFANDFTKPLNTISGYMKRLSSKDVVDYDNKLPVVSNDEIGDLTINFNKILDLEKQYVETIKQNQDILVENERLSSLGQLIGGIAHNLKTPIMSVSGYLVAIEKLADEYRDSIGNPMVTKQDYEDITKEMKEWIDKSKDYMTYMTEVINAAKGQAVSMNANTIGSFSMKELIIRTQILMKEELKKYNCNLNVKLNINENTEIKGELSAIVQVLDNLISNAMQAYGNKEGEINMTANEDAEKVYIEIQDFAGGIPEHIKDKLFKEMITTKGKDGTGLGLYMCYSTIKGKFNGDIRFESEAGVGTTFYITLNKVL